MVAEKISREIARGSATAAEVVVSDIMMMMMMKCRFLLAVGQIICTGEFERKLMITI